MTSLSDLLGDYMTKLYINCLGLIIFREFEETTIFAYSIKEDMVSNFADVFVAGMGCSL